MSLLVRYSEHREKHYKAKFPKTLLVCGIYSHNTKTQKVIYEVALYGQGDKEPEVVFIRNFTGEFDSHTSLMNKCRKIYCEYFQTDNSDIVHLDWLIEK